MATLDHTYLCGLYIHLCICSHMDMYTHKNKLGKTKNKLQASSIRKHKKINKIKSILYIKTNKLGVGGAHL